MRLKMDENVLVVSNKTRDLNEVLDTLVSKDSKKVAAYLVEHSSLPREIRIGALRLVLNDYVKMAKELVLSDEFMYRLNWYEKFSEYQLVNFWNILVSNNAEVFDEAKEAVRFKRTFYLLLLLNANEVELSDKELEELLSLSTPESTEENFKEFMSESDGAFYDYEYNFDGMSYEDFKTTLKKCSTVSDIRNIAAKYDINVPKRLKKEELVALVLEGLRRQGKADETTEATLKKMSAISLQRYAKVNGVKASTEMKKDDIIEFIMNRIESSPKSIRKPRIKLATLPELEAFEFSKDYLREVSAVVDEDDDAPVVEQAPAVEETPVAEPVAEVVEEVVVEEPVVEEVIEEPVVEEPVAEEAPVEEMVEEPVVEEVAEEPETAIIEEEVVEEVVEEEPAVEEIIEEEEEEIPAATQVTNVYNDQLLATIVRLLEDRDSKDAVSQAYEERFNAMVELYEKRIAYIEEILKEIRSNPVPININVNYPTGETSQVVTVAPTPVVEEVMEEVVEEAPVEEVVEETPVVMEEVAEEAPVEEVVEELPVEEETAIEVVEEATIAEETPAVEAVVEETVVEETPVVMEEVAEEVCPVVVDSTFDTLTPAERAHVVKSEMGAATTFEYTPAASKKVRKEDKKLRKLAKKKAKLEKIRAKNDKAIYRKAKRRAFAKFVKSIIVIAILLVLAAFTITTLIDLSIIQGEFATLVNDLTTKYLPFMAPEGVARSSVSGFVTTAIEFVKGLFGAAPAE